MGLITKADDERLDRTKGLSYPSEAVLVASLRAALEEIDIIKSLHYAKSPCGHSSQYAFTEDGGKNIVCLQCSRAALRAALEREQWHVKLEARVYCADHLPTAKESQVIQPCPWCEVRRVYKERIALRADLTAALAQLAEKEARIKELEEREISTLDRQAKENMRIDGVIAEKKDQVCAMREAAALAVNHLHASNETKEKVYGMVKAALSSSSPCRHEEEAKRWKEYAEHQEHCAACGEAVSDCAEGSELRRRAGGEG